MEKPKAIDETTAKERVSGEKLKSYLELRRGTRAMDFDAMLGEVPDHAGFQRLLEALNKPEMKNVIFDVDGTLVPPYADIPETVLSTLKTYLDAGKKLFAYTNSPHSERLQKLTGIGITIIEVGHGKPGGFEAACDKYGLERDETAMVGNFAITDMPLVERGEDPLFPVNLLVESLPPQRKLVQSWGKYFRARFFHLLNQHSAKIVLKRNDGLILQLPKER